MYGGVAGLVGMTNESHMYEVIDPVSFLLHGVILHSKTIPSEVRYKTKVWRELQR